MTLLLYLCSGKLVQERFETEDEAKDFRRRLQTETWVQAPSGRQIRSFAVEYVEDASK